MTRQFAHTGQRGFTLVEAIVVITVIGVLGGIVALFIRMPIQGYADSVERAELTDVADLALRRMTRELRLALPNSIRVDPTGKTIEFLLTKTGGRYLSAEDGVADALVLDFTDRNNLDLTVVGLLPTGKQQIDVNRDYLVVYNLGPGFSPANAYALSSPDRNIARIVGVSASANLLSLSSNPFAVQDPPMSSPTQRFHVVSGPVSYHCGPETGGTTSLSRQSNYPIKLDQLVPPVPANAQQCEPDPLTGPQRCLIASRVAACNFAYENIANTRNALVTLTLELQPRNGSDATVRLVHQVHVDNTP
jgi:MSHA biogenesis protein MshO